MDYSLEERLREAIELQETMPLPVVKVVYVRSDGLLTLRQVREGCGLNLVQLARAAKLRPIVVDWCERGRGVRPAETAQILTALAGYLNGVPRCSTFGLWEGGRL